MAKINIAELLKDCPKGMELDSTFLEGLEFDSIVDNDYLPIRCRIKNPNGGYNVYNFTKHGYWFDSAFAKCLIFPKGKNTWEGFVPPCKFKDGDILTTDLGSIFVLKEPSEKECYYSCYIALNDVSRIVKSYTPFCIKEGCRLATKEEKEKLFDAIKDNGYKWNAETKTLEKLITPKFKVGDRIRHKESGNILKIDEIDISDSTYCCSFDCVWVADQDKYELVPNKFDIATLKPFDKVLVRDGNKDKWNIDFFGYYRDDGTYQCMTFTKNQCIPYEVNKELLGTTNNIE